MTFKVKPLLERQLQAFDRGKEVKGSFFAIARLNGVYFVVATVWFMMEEGQTFDLSLFAETQGVFGPAVSPVGLVLFGEEESIANHKVGSVSEISCTFLQVSVPGPLLLRGTVFHAVPEQNRTVEIDIADIGQDFALVLDAVTAGNTGVV